MSDQLLEAPQAITLDSLRESFHDEKQSEKTLSRFAGDMQIRLSWYFKAGMKLEPRTFEGIDFNSFYDPTLPTIAVDNDHTFSGSELLGLASHEDTTRANVIYIPTVTNGSAIMQNPENGESHLEIKSGAIVLPSGQVAYGEFPKPITADILETADLALIEQCEASRIPLFHSSEKMRRFNDKANVETLSNNVHTYTPRRIGHSAFLNLETTENLVIKPSKHSQGRGVLLTDNDADADHTKRFYRFLVDNNYEPIVEQRARSWEIADPKTGVRLDWNVRAILSYGDLIDMYVRADSWGGPVNMSVSAHAISMEKFSEYFKNREDAVRVMEVLHDSAQAVAEENPSSLIGIDLTVDEDGKACLFEINNGNTGGLQTIARLEKTYDDKLDMTRKVLRNFIDNTPPKNDQQPSAIDSEPLRPSFNTLAGKAYYGGLSKKLGMLDLREIPTDEDERYGAVLALVAIRTNFYWVLSEMSVHQEAGQRLRDEYPLELRKHLTSIFASSKGERHLLSPYLLEHSELFLDDAGAVTLQGKIFAEQFDLAACKDIYHQTQDRFAERAPYFYEHVRSEFEGHFTSLTSDLDPSDQQAFSMLLENVITAYCEYDYETSDKLITATLTRSGIQNPLTNAIYSLRFCMAYKDGRYDDAERYFYDAEDDFDDRYDFHEHISDEMVSRSVGDLREYSKDAQVFAAKINIRSNGPVIATTDMLDFMTGSDVDDTTRMQIIEVIADRTPLEHTLEEREAFIETLRKASITRSIMLQEKSSLPDIGTISDYSKFALLIEKVFAGEIDAAKLLIENLKEVHVLDNGLDYLLDVFIENPSDWGR